MKTLHLNPHKRFPQRDEGYATSMEYHKGRKTTNLGHAASRRRNTLWAKTLEAATQSFIDKVKIKKGMTGLDLNCQQGQTSLLLAKAVGKKGTVVGMDRNKENLNLSTKLVKTKKLQNVYFKELEALYGSAQEMAFDFVFGRSLFSESSDPKSLAYAIYRNLRPEGVILLEEEGPIHFGCYPYCYAFERFSELSIASQKNENKTLNGQRFADVLRHTGFINVQVQLSKRTFLKGKSRQLASLTFESKMQLFQNENLASSEELNALLNEIRSFEKVSQNLVNMPGIYQVWGYKK